MVIGIWFTQDEFTIGITLRLCSVCLILPQHTCQSNQTSMEMLAIASCSGKLIVGMMNAAVSHRRLLSPNSASPGAFRSFLPLNFLSILSLLRRAA